MHRIQVVELGLKDFVLSNSWLMNKLPNCRRWVWKVGILPQTQLCAQEMLVVLLEHSNQPEFLMNTVA